MKTSGQLIFFFILLAIAIQLSLSLLCDAITPQQQVCSTSKYPQKIPTCNKILSQSPCGGGGDLICMGNFIIGKAKEATNYVQQNIPPKSVVKGPIDDCNRMVKAALTALTQCSEYLKEKKVPGGVGGGINIKASGAMTDLNTCQDGFKGGVKPDLKTAIAKANDFIDVLLVISNNIHY